MDSREIITRADEIRKEQGLSQAEWTRRAGMDNGGVAVCRIYNRGDCKLKTMNKLLRPLGYALTITKLEDLP